jgi:hypothetical protein
MDHKYYCKMLQSLGVVSDIWISDQESNPILSNDKIRENEMLKWLQDAI